MQTKYEKYEQLGTETLQGLMRNQETWTSFLATSSRMYKYTFDEQVLIHAQRPDTRACADFAFWTARDRMNRHLKAGTRSISLVGRENHKLYYVYAVEDTEPRRNGTSRDPEKYIWKLESSKASGINDLLCRSGRIQSSDIAETVVKMAYAAARQSIAQYDEEFAMLYAKNAPDVPSEILRAQIAETMAESAAYMALLRCGLEDAAAERSFPHLGNFDTDFTSLIGKGTGDIARTVLRTVERTVHEYNRQERMNQHEQQLTQGESRERNPLHSGRGDTDVSGGLRGDRGAELREVRDGAREVPQGALRSDLLADDRGEHVSAASERDRRESREDGGRDRSSDGSTGRNGRGTENSRSHDMGRSDEQLQGSSRGSGSERTDLRITETEQAAEASETQTSAVSVSDDDFAERIHAAFAEIGIDRSFTEKQQQFLDRLEKFAVKQRVTADLIVTAFRDSAMFRNTYGGLRWLSQKLFAGRVKALENQLNAALEKHFSPEIIEEERPAVEQAAAEQPYPYLAERQTDTPVIELDGGVVDLREVRALFYESEREDIVQYDESEIYRENISFRYDTEQSGIIMTASNNHDLFDTEEFLSPDEAAAKIRELMQDAPNTIKQMTVRTPDNVLHTLSDYLTAQHSEKQETEQQTFQIYQIKSGEQYRGIRFESLADNTNANLNRDDYDFVYEGNWSEIAGSTTQAKLEHLYQAFNSGDKPTGYSGHSLSVSDVITVSENGVPTSYYVDKAGFAEMPGFFQEKQQTTEITDPEKIHFGLLGNGITCYDVSRTDPETHDYPIVAHISEEGNVRIYDHDLAQEDLDRINHEAEQQRARFIADWNERPLEQRWYEILNRTDAAQMRQIVHEPLSLEERVKKYEGSVIFGDESFPEMTEPEPAQDAPIETAEPTTQELVPDAEKAVFLDFRGDPHDIRNINIEFTRAIQADSFGSFVADGNKFSVIIRNDATVEDVRQLVATAQENHLYLYSSSEELLQSRFGEDYMNDAPALEEQSEEPVMQELVPDAEQDDLSDILSPEAIAEVREALQQPPAENALVQEITEMVQEKINSDEFAQKIADIMEDDTPAQPSSTVSSSPDVTPDHAEHFHITNENLAGGGAKTKFRANVDAIRALKTIESGNRAATPEERAIIAQYSGWGGLAEAFDDRKENWSKEYAELKSLLTPEEYSAARSSTVNAHYTPPDIFAAIFQKLQNSGFDGGRILEPAAGIGNVFGAMPDALRTKSDLVGVELDDLSGRIMKTLYPDVQTHIQGYETTKFSDNSFDLAIGNVPFGSFSLNEKQYNKHHFLIHDHFFAKSLDKVKSGGLVAFITSKGTLDKQNPDVRKYLAERAELVGAVRFPNDTFKANAGTEVTADLVILKKRENPIELTPENTPDWVHLGQTEDGLTVNSYFAEHPDMVLGKIVEGNKLYGRQDGDTSCESLPDQDTMALLHQALDRMEIPVEQSRVQRTERTASERVDIPLGLPDNSYAVIGNKLYYRNGDKMQPFKAGTRSKKVPQQEERIRAMLPLRDTLRELLKIQTEDASDTEIRALQETLGKQYDAFTTKFGLLHEDNNARAIKADAASYLLNSLEEVKEGKVVGKAAVFSKRTIKANHEVTHAESANDALAVSLNAKGHVDMDYMAEITGFTQERLLHDLQGVVYENPLRPNKDGSPRYETADEFLSGNVREKLNTMRENYGNDPAYAGHIAALEAAMPIQKTFADADIRLGMRCVSPEIVTQFMHDTFKTPVYFRHTIRAEYFSDKEGSGWEITNKKNDRHNRIATSMYGTKRISPYDILERILNRQQIKITDPVEREDGSKTYVLNQEETDLANDQKCAIENAFQDWLVQHPQICDQIMEQYNIAYSSKQPRKYDGSHLEFPSMTTEIKLRDHQKNAVARVLYGGNTLLAHEVGAGKTYTMIASIMEGKRLGLHNKSLLCVPNHLTEQIGGDFLKLYPNANILVAMAADFKKENRRKLFAKIATGDYDAVIIGHTQLANIPISPARQERLLQDQIDSIMEQLEAAKAQNGNSLSVKRLVASEKNLRSKLQKLLDAPRKDNVVSFEELGIDQLVLDEAHEFKNCFISTKMGNVNGLSTNDNVQKTMDLLLKCRYIDEITNGTGLIFSTGTPVSNQLAELYVFMNYLQHDLLVEMGLEHFDDFAAEFLEIVTESQINVEGTGYQTVTRIASYNNCDELTELWRESADIVTQDMMHLPRPECITETVVAKPTETQKMMIDALSELAAKIRAKKIDKREATMLTVTERGRKIGLDQRLMNPDLPDEPNTKVNLCVDNVFRIWEENKEKRSTQLIFCDQGVPKDTPKNPKSAEGAAVLDPDAEPQKRRHCVYDDIKAKLIAKGIPAEEIAFIHDAKNEEQKDKLFAKVRKGEIRVLIGSTAKMGAGTNVQDKLIASHDLDAPWKPSDMEQRKGRMVRQGNENPTVHLYRYVTEGTFDAYIFQKLEQKQAGISAIMTGTSTAHNCEAMDEVTLSFAEVKALATNNPDMKERMELEAELPKLRQSKKAHISRQAEMQNNILHVYPAQIAGLTTRVAAAKQDIATAEANPIRRDEKNTPIFAGMEVGGKQYADKDAAGAALLSMLKESVVHHKGEPLTIGKYRGFEIMAEFDAFRTTYVGYIKGAGTYKLDFSGSELGNITRLDNLIGGLSERLELLQNSLETATTQLEDSKRAIGAPFPREDELRQKEQRLEELVKKFEQADKENETVEVSDHLMEIGTSDQLAALKASGIPFQKAETSDGKIIVKVKPEHKEAAQSAIRGMQSVMKR